MKLIKCHIENFGKLQNFDFNFSEGLNNIKHENGWGKSTFAAFIKSMFYGLPVTTKRDLDENERKKYLPWQGGNYGGNIDFVVNAKQYRIERFFGKNNADDIFNLIDLTTGKKSSDYSTNIGEEIFGLDEEAFERSSFIPQKDLDSKPNDSINNKLTNLIQGTRENFNYDYTHEILNKKRISLFNNKGSGRIQEIENQVEDLVCKIKELELEAKKIPVIQEQIDDHDKEIKTYTLQQEQIKKQIVNYTKVQQKIANQELYQKLNQQLDSTQNEINKNQEIFNGIVTSVSEVEFFETINNKVLQKEDELNFNQKNNYLKTRYVELIKYFGDENSIPSPSKIEEVSNNLIKYNAIKFNTIETINTKNQSLNMSPKAKIGLPLGISVFCMILALALVAFVLPVAIVLFAGALSAGFVACFLYFKNLINIKTSLPNQAIYQNFEANQTELLLLKRSLEEFLNKYETNVQDYQEALNNIFANYKDYKNIKNKLELSESENIKLITSINQEKEKVKNYLIQFNLDRSTTDAQQLSSLKRLLIDTSNLKERLILEQSELEKFKIEKNFNNEDLEINNIDINLLQNQERLIQNEIDRCRDSKSQKIALINEIQDDISILDILENEKEALEIDLQNLKKELNSIKNAKKFLEIANDSLTSQFLTPMKNGLSKYLKVLTEKDFDNLKLDTDFNINFEEYGKLREISYYSKGYKNIIDLCMRFSLIDALYEHEKPFIVLDDPFINMDDTKINNAKNFLKELSKDYQLIYFSCHESRC